MAAGRDRPVALVGARGAGKSTVGARLARALGRTFVDADELLARLAGRPAADVLREDAARFRDLEARALREALATPDVVVATGGGVVLRDENRAALQAAFVVWLAAPAEVLAARVAADARDRPALHPGGPLAEARAVLVEREPLYRTVAHATIDASGSVDDVVAAVVEALG